MSKTILISFARFELLKLPRFTFLNEVAQDYTASRLPLKLHRHKGMFPVRFGESVLSVTGPIKMGSVADHFREVDDEALYAKLNRDQKYKDIIQELDQHLHKYYFDDNGTMPNGNLKLQHGYIRDAAAAVHRINDIKGCSNLLRNNLEHLNAYDLWARAMLRMILEVNHLVFASRRINSSTKSAALSLVQDWATKRDTARLRALVSLMAHDENSCMR